MSSPPALELCALPSPQPLPLSLYHCPCPCPASHPWALPLPGMYDNGGQPPGEGSPPLDPDFIAVKNETHKRNIDFGLFLVHHLLRSRPPSPPPLFLCISGLYPCPPTPCPLPLLSPRALCPCPAPLPPFGPSSASQVKGKKSGVLFPPQALPWFTGAHLPADEPDFIRFPDEWKRALPMQPLHFEYEAGDLAFVPRCWLHEVYTEETSVTLTFNFNYGVREVLQSAWDFLYDGWYGACVYKR